MPRRAVPLVAGECYHVYSRGSHRQRIFYERENHLFSLGRVRERQMELLQAFAFDSHFQQAGFQLWPGMNP